MAWIIGSVTDAEYETLRAQGWHFGNPKHFKLPERSDAGEKVVAVHTEADVAKVMELVGNL
jgi:hypothetical protein